MLRSVRFQTPSAFAAVTRKVFRPGGQVGVGHEPVCAVHLDPAVVETLQAVSVASLPRSAIVQRREFERNHTIGMGQRNRARLVDRLAQRRPISDLRRLVGDEEVREHDRRDIFMVPNLVGVERDQTVTAAHQQLPAARRLSTAVVLSDR